MCIAHINQTPIFNHEKGLDSTHRGENIFALGINLGVPGNRAHKERGGTVRKGF